MRLVWLDNSFVIEPNSEDFIIPLEDLVIAKERAGFRFDSASATWRGDAEAVQRLRPFSLKLKSKLSITNLALEKYREAGGKFKDAAEESRAIDTDVIIPVPEGLELMPFQRAGVAYMAKRRSILLSDEMGCGKTPQSICLVNTEPEAKNVLVICPATLKINWSREFRKWDVKHLPIQIVNGTKPIQFQPGCVVINYDILQAHRVALRDTKWDVLICDEAHYLRNKRTDRTREVFGGVKRDADRKIVDRCCPIPACRIILATGTPIVNKPKELWPIISAIDPEGLGSDWLHYAQRYCQAFKFEFAGRTGWKWDGAANLEELQEIMRSRFMVRRLKKDVLKDLPAKRRQVIVLEPKPALKKLVASEVKTYEEHAESLKTKDTLAILPSFEGLSELRKKIAIQKAPYVIEHVEEVLKEQDKVVLFCHHHEVADLFAQTFDKLAVLVDGRVSLNDRQVAVDRFQNDPSCQIFIGGIQSAGVGLTLTAASTVIFAELDWVPANLSQAEDRLHRIGQKEQVLVQHLVLEGSLDERMVEVLIGKQEIADKALDREAA